ncbi:MAG: efflux RND transporter permease subunit [Lachnospiraceae bacterium]|nr:efflux RND transporter permease subunit [Lachnospiraceae bacterium]
MNLTKTALKRPVSCVLIVVALVVFSISSLLGFKLELTPSMELPMLIVVAVYPGADPETVDELVTKVVEDAGSSLSGVEDVTAVSMENMCQVLFQYEYGVDIDECYADLRSALDTASLSLPEDVDTPTVIEMNMNSMPNMYLSATEIGDIDLGKVLNESVVPDLEKISGVAQVEVSGGSEEYIKVELNETLMNQYGLTMDSIAQALTMVDFTYPAGSVTQGKQNINVTTGKEYNTVQQLRKAPLTTGRGSVITLQDVAEVSMSAKASDYISRYDGKEDVSISIQTKSSYGTVNVCNDIKAALERIKAENPAIAFEITYDASEAIVDSIWSVGQTLILGIVLSMVVLFLFFGDFKASLIVGASMPVSLFVTLILMNAMGYSLNIVTMGSLVIAIGMMVDSSIVVIESCFRMQEKKTDFKEAALTGTKIVTASIVASTITTIVVYVPLAVSKGLSGQLFVQLGFTIVFAMLASLIVALTLVPLCYSKFRPVEKKDIPMNKILRTVTKGYKRLLRKLLHKRFLVIAASVLMVVVSIMMGSKLNMEMMPSADEGTVGISVNFRAGTRVESIDEQMKEWVEIVSADEDVEHYSYYVNGTNAGISAYLKKDRSRDTVKVVDEWNELAKEMTGMDITVSSSGSSMSTMMSTGSYEIDLQGRDMEVLKDFASQLEGEFLKVDGVVKVDNSTSGDSIQARIDVDELQAMQYGLTPITVGMAVGNATGGKKAMTVTREGSEYEVRLEYPEGAYEDMNSLLNLNILSPMGVTVPLRDIAQIVYEEAQESIYKQNGLYQVALTVSTTSDKYYEAQAGIDAIVESAVFPETVSPADSMMTAMMMEEFYTLVKAILTAVFLVFLVMAMQFESPRFSFMVMMCVPFALVGSFIFLFLTGSTISMVSLMGFLMLMGIVVNNGILYVDSTNRLKEEMTVEEALIETGAIRLRPILMTSLTTILSMIPMGLALGTNGQMMQGMALVIIGGLLVSTLLTLILIPTIYLIIDKESGRERRRNRKERRASRREKHRAKKDTDIEA